MSGLGIHVNFRFSDLVIKLWSVILVSIICIFHFLSDWRLVSSPRLRTQLFLMASVQV